MMLHIQKLSVNKYEYIAIEFAKKLVLKKT